MKRITNIDSLSALIDRLITERIKLFFFEKDGKEAEANHQKIVISEITDRISTTFEECFIASGYDYIGERRTFDENSIIESIEQLIVADIWIGEGDRARLSEVTSEKPNMQLILKNEKITRRANETRAKNKNLIDQLFAGVFKKWIRNS